MGVGRLGFWGIYLCFENQPTQKLKMNTTQPANMLKLPQQPRNPIQPKNISLLTHLLYYINSWQIGASLWMEWG